MNTEIHDYDFMQRVADAFLRADSLSCGSFRAVAMQFGITRTKVRKILITLGAIESPLPEEALQLQESGMKLQEISEKLSIPISTLSTYLPYVTVMYNGEERSANAMRIGTFRERLATIAQMHHHPEGNHPSPAQHSTGLKKIRVFSQNNTQNKVNPMLRATNFPVMRLRLELNLDGLPKEDWEALHQYCDVKKGYSREILAPSDMTLHGLHYAIMQLFGWLNGHLRCFSLPKKLLEELTHGRLDDYLELAGVYFRSPVEPDDDDQFWDDNYEGDSSFKSWLRKRYTRPFDFRGRQEQFMAAQKEAKEFRRRLQQGNLRQLIEERRQTNDVAKKYAGKGNAIMLEELRSLTDFTYGDLLERLKLSEILGPDKIDSNGIAQLRQKAKDYYEHNLNSLARLKKSGNARAELDGSWVPITPLVHPITDTLNYEFDFGDGWEIKITWCKTYASCDLDNVADELAEQIRTIMKTGRPLCIAMDGSRQLVQDVGGISGYCDFLRVINGNDTERKREMKEWASGLNWNGRKATPEKLL